MFIAQNHSPCPKASLINYHSGCMHSYGENCQYPCGKHCVNQTCNRFHGICQFGCETGYIGQKCEQGMYTCIWILTRNMFTNFFENTYYRPALSMSTYQILLCFIFRISIKQLFIFWFYWCIYQRMRVNNYSGCNIYDTVVITTIIQCKP